MRTPGPGRGRAWQPLTVLAALSVAVSAGPGAAATEALDGLRACRAIADAAQRLACFDRESAALAPANKGPSVAPEQMFGLSPEVVAEKESAAGARPTSLSELNARLTSITRNVDGRFVFTLDNGQVWQQVVPEDDLLSKTGDQVKLSHGALGSFWLRAASGRGCKVRRIR
jgi:hypothetical protein